MDRPAPTAEPIRAIKPETLWSSQEEKPRAEIWRVWKLRFNRYIRMLKTEIDDKEKKDLFLTFAGPGAEEYLISFVDVESDQVTTKILEDRLEAHLDKVPNVVAARHNFRQLKQGSTEDIASYSHRLKKEVGPCKWNAIEAGKVEDVMLVQQFLSGIKDETLRGSLLTDGEKSQDKYEEMVTLARNKEDIKVVAENLGSKPLNQMEVDKLRKFQARGRARGVGRGIARRISNSRPFPPQRPPPGMKCFACGYGISNYQQHRPQCPARSNRCKVCHKLGHWERLCRNKGVKNVNEEYDETPEYEEYDEEPEILEESTEDVYNIRKNPQHQTTTAEIEDDLPSQQKKTVSIVLPDNRHQVRVQMEPDCGAPCVFIPRKLWDHKLQGYFGNLQKSRFTFKGYGNETIPCAGWFKAKIKSADKEGI